MILTYERIFLNKYTITYWMKFDQKFIFCLILNRFQFNSTIFLIFEYFLKLIFKYIKNYTIEEYCLQVLCLLSVYNAELKVLYWELSSCDTCANTSFAFFRIAIYHTCSVSRQGRQNEWRQERKGTRNDADIRGTFKAGRTSTLLLINFAWARE